MAAQAQTKGNFIKATLERNILPAGQGDGLKRLVASLVAPRNGVNCAFCGTRPNLQIGEGATEAILRINTMPEHIAFSILRYFSDVV
jgi:hypothetical protein